MIRRLSVALLCVLGATAAFAAQTMSVQIRSAQLRADASFLGKLVANVDYGAQVEVQQAKGDWRFVQTPDGATGWLHQSALTAKKIVMKAGAQDAQTAASGEELALAGKGFNADVEADFKKKNQDIDFTWIDRMEKIRVSQDEMIAFLKEGEVQPVQRGGP